ncbi:hypothetical protein D9758_001246 [Tetrapyrgos nigripes]|uniref:Pentatricopeptide repeat-containing protein n=1 Tax=Tetrapyrgos nigripes TaxID=182062 RepID=A0A8H5LUI8_9AGAR|nr:hypothetical protein D9758_001246 [Tetrapyrgos nigripes]
MALPSDLQDLISSANTHSTHSLQHHEKFQALHSSLNEEDVQPGKVWLDYVGLLNSVGYEHLDLSIHQEVLRKCTLYSRKLRDISNHRLRTGHDPLQILPESRFRTIIRNIHASGMKPSIHDYNFVLEQFAAVGHHKGAMQVFEELTKHSIPQQRSFGFCLQAIAHRLSITINPSKRPPLLVQARAMMSELMGNMQKYSVPFSNINLDFTMRILKETSDLAGFESLLKQGYGIDMAYPDRPALELSGAPSVFGADSVPVEPVQFSVSTLNAVVDMYGSAGNISRMVQAFEVLAVPLPAAQQHFFSSFEDDDDFGVASKSSTASFTPHAQPNSKTLKIMLKHLAKADHFQLMRHYILVALELDRAVDRQTRVNVVTSRGYHHVPSPHFAVDKAMFAACVTKSGVAKRSAFMRWLEARLRVIIRKKKNDLEFYKNHARGAWRRNKLPSGTPPSEKSGSNALSTSELKPVQIYFRGHRWRVFNVEDKVSFHHGPPPRPPPSKPLNLYIHNRHLEKTIKELEGLRERLERIKARKHDRVKDRLGRRVWGRKDIYLSNGGDRRGRVSRQRWREIVNYKPREMDAKDARSAEMAAYQGT